MRSHIYTLSILLTLPVSQSAQAELTLCDGHWTNQPCSGEVEQKLRAVEKSTAQVEAEQAARKQRSDKRSLVHEQTMKQLRARDEHKIAVDMLPVSDFCLQDSTSVNDCRKELDLVAERIEPKVAEAERLKAQQRANQLQEQNNEIEKNKVPVIVINNMPTAPVRQVGGLIQQKGTVANGGTIISIEESLVVPRPHAHGPSGSSNNAAQPTTSAPATAPALQPTPNGPSQVVVEPSPASGGNAAGVYRGN